MNGFAIGYSKTECGILFMLNQEPTVQLFLPFPVALALVDNLKDIITHYETTTKQQIPKFDSIPIVTGVSAKT